MKNPPKQMPEMITGITFKLTQKIIIVSIEADGEWREFAQMYESSEGISAESVKATAAMLAAIKKS